MHVFSAEHMQTLATIKSVTLKKMFGGGGRLSVLEVMGSGKQ